MALCRVTGTLYLPNGEPASDYQIKLSRHDKRVAAGYLGSIVPSVVTANSDASGDVDFSILTGAYHGAATPLWMSGGIGFNFEFIVPDQDEARFSDCVGESAPVDPPPEWLGTIEAATNIAEAAASVAEDAVTEAQEASSSAAQSAARVDVALDGSPYQVVSTDAASGKAEARDIGVLHVIDVSSGPGDADLYYIPGYYEMEGKARGLFATNSIIDYGWGVIPLRNLDRTISSTDPTVADHLATKRYVDKQADRATWAIAPNFTDDNDPLPSPRPISGQRSCLAIGYGSHSLHTNPGPNNNGGSLAAGHYAYANGLHCTAVGTLAKAGPLLADDEPDPAATGLLFATAIGNNARATANHSEALGCRTRADNFMSVALGTESVTTATNEVSVGNATVKRRITNVASPTAASDAATKAYVDAALSPAQRAAINALVPIADTSVATPQQVATLLNSLIAALKGA